MNNKKIFFALMALTAAVGVSAGIKSKRRKKPYSSGETLKQAWEYKKAINNVLTEECLRNFSDFASALNEYYGITAKCCDCNTIEYSSGKYIGVLTSNDVIRTQGNAEIRLECMSDLEDYFLFNRTDTTGHLPEHYSPFYYGNHLHRGEPVMLNRRNLSISTNHLLCGIAGTGKTAHMKHEIQSALFKTNDRVFVITGTDEYNGIADGYDGVIEIDKENKPIYISDDKRFVVYSFEKIRYENQSALPEYYLKCLETVWEYVCNNVNPDRLSWIFIDDIQDIICDERCMSVLYDIIIKARTHGCTVTLSTQCLHRLIESEMGKKLLMNTNFLTLFALGIADKDFILDNYKEVLSEPDILFLEVLCSKIQHGKGLHIVNGRLIDDNNSGNLTAIPFEIKL